MSTEGLRRTVRPAGTGAVIGRTACALASAGLLLVAGPALAEPLPAGGAGEPAIAVADPYLDLHTGPGRGYPVFHVAARGERIVLLLRHTDWLKVRTEKGVEGWVPRRQLQASLAAAGAPVTDAAADDPAGERFEAGAAFGRFKAEPMWKGFASWRMSPAFRLEGTVGQVQGLYAGTGFWHVGLNTEPWAGQRLSPSMGIGFGRFHNLPNASLVAGSPTDAALAQFNLGLRWRLGERWLLRADYTLHTVYLDSRRTGEYRSITGGLAVPF